MAGLTVYISSFVGLNIQTVLVAILTILIAVFWRNQNRTIYNLPPGPKGLPLVGMLFDLVGTSEPAERIRIYGRQYKSDILQFNIVGQQVITLHSIDVMRQALQIQGDEFDRRPEMELIKLTNKGHGIVAANDRIWKEHRRFSLSVLRDFGMGKMAVEDIIQEEIRCLTSVILSKSESAFQPDLLFEVAVSNIICSICFGNRFAYGDEDFIYLQSLLTEVVQLEGRIALTYLPFLRHVPGDMFGFKRLFHDVEEIRKFLNVRLSRHKTSFDKYNIRDFIDTYIAEMKRREDEGETDTTFTDIQLLYVIMDLFFAGSETTTTTLRWAILLMILNPDVQDKVQEEIDREVPRSRIPTMQDREKLTYTMATINEVQRYASILPLSVVHSCKQDTKINGYDIPKGSFVLPFLYAVHRDENLWKNPFNFDPENFLDGSCKLVGQENLIPFGIGKRACLGESLAKMELFMFFTAMLQKFKFTVDPDKPKPDLKRNLGLVVGPSCTYTVLASVRE